MNGINSFNNLAAFCTDNCINYPQEFPDVTSTVKPITENPKVREISYTVSVKAIDYQKALWQVIEKHARTADHILTYKETIKYLQDLVKFHLYNFNNENSRKLSDFYNPLDNTQKQLFLNFLQEKLNFKLADVGVAIVDVQWDVK